MQSAVLFAGMPGPVRKVVCLASPTSGIPMEAKMADYIRPTLAPGWVVTFDANDIWLNGSGATYFVGSTLLMAIGLAGIGYSRC